MYTNTPTATTANPNRRYLCRHIFTDGHRCGSPSLGGQDLCYYHTRTRHEGASAGRSGTFPMSHIDDRAAVQIALYDVLSRVAGGDIDVKRGSVLLYGLQIASSNLGRPQPVAEQPPQVEQVIHDYDLGDLAPITEILKSPSGAVILSEEHRDESEAWPERSLSDPDTFHPTPDPGAILQTQAIALPVSDPQIPPQAPKAPAPHLLREYTRDEKIHLNLTTGFIGYKPIKAPLPESLTDADVIAAINVERHFCGYGPIENEPTWNPETLTAPLPPTPTTTRLTPWTPPKCHSGALGLRTQASHSPSPTPINLDLSRLNPPIGDR